MKSGCETARNNPRALEKVRGIFASLSKYVQAKTIYAGNNPNLAKFAGAFHDACQSFFQDEKELVLSVEQSRLKWAEETVYDNPDKSDSLAFLLYKDGVGEITIQSTAGRPELERFVDVLRGGLHNQTSHFDIVSRLWMEDFAGISFRVFDECAEGTAGDGHGKGNASRDQLLQAGDHVSPANPELQPGAGSPPYGGTPEPLGVYVERLVARVRPGPTLQQNETQMQEMLSSLFKSSPEDLASWRSACAQMHEGDKLLTLLRIMLDFAEMRSSPPVVRDITDIIDRLVRYIVEEAHVPTLIALLDIQRNECARRPFTIEFQALSSRVEHEITNGPFLLSLGRTKGRSAAEAQEALAYFRLIGERALPGVCELLSTLKEPSLHRETCDTLLEIAAKEVPRIVGELRLDNPVEVRDAVYLLRRSGLKEIHPIAAKLMASSDLRVKEQVIEYLVDVGGDEAARMLCTLLRDNDAGIRTKTYAAVEEFPHPLVTETVMETCFAEDTSTRGADELERMFRAAGRLGGERTLVALRHLLGKGSWLRIGKGRGKQNKLLAITALRCLSGREAQELLGRLADDGDSLVRTKALYALKHLATPADSSPEEPATVGGEHPTP